MNPDNLFLVGYRCTGKSSVGRSLAATLSLPFIDTDSLVVSENGMSIREIVISRGWEAFRRLEHTALQQVCTMDRRVAATGRGIVLDIDKVDAQQTRRILDRIVGYKLSPLLWDKVRRGISAGRVQSVALRLVVDREREREAFVAEEYWSLKAHLEGDEPPPTEG